jgi:hypothetical protein
MGKHIGPHHWLHTPTILININKPNGDIIQKLLQTIC